MSNHNPCLPLQPEPRDEWTHEWERLVANPWLRKKLNRSRRIRDHLEYLDDMFPEFWGMAPGIVIDLGPGAGELLEIARSQGHRTIGVDAASGDGGMGAAYLAACELMWERQGLQVYIGGGIPFLMTAMRDIEEGASRSLAGKCSLINSRGSMEQVFASHMLGEPHHLHHRAANLAWDLTCPVFRCVLRRMLAAVASMLRPDGAFVVHFNGSQNADEAERTFDAAAKSVGLRLQKADPRKRVWRGVC